jgi:2-amino-4-hydroxy-6-hydroxymethyldihydropteridine diphosphokinase
MTTAALGLGANLGDARQALADAVACLVDESGVDVVGVSRLWRTAPIGGPEQPDYLNAVVLVETVLTPGQLLALGQRLEAAAGRVRDVRWGPRTLDVDVLDVVGFTSSDASLTIPHPRAHERAFVLVPWAEIAPEWILVDAGGVARSVASRADAISRTEPPGSITVEQEGSWWR